MYHSIELILIGPRIYIPWAWFNYIREYKLRRNYIESLSHPVQNN